MYEEETIEISWPRVYLFTSNLSSKYSALLKMIHRYCIGSLASSEEKRDDKIIREKLTKLIKYDTGSHL